jgi:hypothetical protein
MDYNPPVPTVDGFQWAAKQFATNNTSGSCAGFAHTWLAFSLLQGSPVTSAGVLSNHGLIAAIHQGKPKVNAAQKFQPLRGSSAKTLPDSGFAIEQGYPQQPASSGWKDLFDALANLGDGHYDLTIKQPFKHAMACIVKQTQVYDLEPQHGLYLIPKSKLSTSLTGFYSQYTWSPQNEYKIYKVQPQP